MGHQLGEVCEVRYAFCACGQSDKVRRIESPGVPRARSAGFRAHVAAGAERNDFSDLDIGTEDERDLWGGIMTVNVAVRERADSVALQYAIEPVLESRIHACLGRDGATKEARRMDAGILEQRVKIRWPNRAHQLIGELVDRGARELRCVRRSQLGHMLFP